MGLLRRLLGGRSPAPVGQPVDAALEALVEAHGLAVLDRQRRLGELVGDRDWHLDQDSGTLRFGDDLGMPVQIIGSTGDRMGTWLWAWSNPSVEDALTERSRAVLEIGRRRGLELLTTPEVPIARIGEGHQLMLAVAGLVDADAYYRCPYDGGAAWVTLTAPEVRQRPDGPLAAHAVAVVTAALAGMPIPMTRQAVGAYLAWLDVPVRETPGGVVAGDDEATFRFDGLDRLVEVAMTRSR